MSNTKTTTIYRPTKLATSLYSNFGLQRIKEQLIISLKSIYEKFYGKSIYYKYYFNPNKRSFDLIKEEQSHNGGIKSEIIKMMDYKFSLTNVYHELNNIVRTSNPFIAENIRSKFIENINLINNDLKDEILLAEKYLIAIEAIEVEKEYSKNSKNLSLHLILPRIKAIRAGKNFEIELAEKELSEKIFNKKLISLDQAIKLYSKGKIRRNEMILAGGDATRYFRFLYLIHDLPNNVEYITEELLKHLSQDDRNSDIKNTITLKNIGMLIDTPLFKNVGFKYEDIRTKYCLKTLKEGVNKVLLKFNPDYIPKAMNYAVHLEIDKQDLYVSFFMASILRTYSEIIKEKTTGNKLYYVVRNKHIANVLKIMSQQLYNENIFCKKTLGLEFIGDIENSVAINASNSFLNFDDNQHLQTTSTGHGPAFIKISNRIREINLGESSCFSVRTMDNIGSKICVYSGILQKAVVAENTLRDKLVKYLKSESKANIIKLLEIKAKEMSTEAIKSKLIQYIDKHWDYKINKDYISSLSDFATQIENLPITVAIVISGASSVGGGLYVDTNGNMSILDKFKLKNKVKQTVSKFNPMLFASLIKKPISYSEENDLIFVTQKNKKGVLIYQGESAATHIATNPRRVLKRIINVEENITEVFKDQKTIDQSHAHNTTHIAQQLAADISLIEEKTKINKRNIINLINNIQEESIIQLNILSSKDLIREPRVSTR